MIKMNDKDNDELIKISLNIPKSIVNLVDREADMERPQLNRTQMLIKMILAYQERHLKKFEQKMYESTLNHPSFKRKMYETVYDSRNSDVYALIFKIIFLRRKHNINDFIGNNLDILTSDYFKPLIGIDIQILLRQVRGIKHTLQVWDIDMEDNFKKLVSGWSDGTHGAIIILDLTSPENFDEIKGWIDELRLSKNNYEITILLIGYKANEHDESVIDLEKIDKFTSDNNIYYMEQLGSSLNDEIDCFNVLTSLVEGLDLFIKKEIVFRPGEVMKIRELIQKWNNIHLKNKLLDLATKYSRLQVIEMAEECDLDEEKILPIVKEMIEKGELKAKYYESTRSVVFRQDLYQNRDEIEQVQKKQIITNFKMKILIITPRNVDINEFLNRDFKNRYVSNHILTTGVEILRRDVEFEPGEIAILSVWYVKDESRFSFIKSTFYKGSAGAIFFFELMAPDTFEAIKLMIDDVKKAISNLPFVLIGLKDEILDDSGVKLDQAKIKKYVKKLGGFYLETELDKKNEIDEAFRELTRRIIDFRRRYY